MPSDVESCYRTRGPSLNMDAIPGKAQSASGIKLGSAECSRLTDHREAVQTVMGCRRHG